MNARGETGPDVYERFMSETAGYLGRLQARVDDLEARLWITTDVLAALVGYVQERDEEGLGRCLLDSEVYRQVRALVDGVPTEEVLEGPSRERQGVGDPNAEI